MGIEERTYRHSFDSELVMSRLTLGETDLAICLPNGVWNSKLARDLSDHLIGLRRILQEYIGDYPQFAATHSPYALPPLVPPLIRSMIQAGNLAGTGPMAAVAGYFAQAAGRFLTGYTDEIIVENGGDIFLAGNKQRIVGIYAGKSPFTGKIGVKLQPEQLPCGVCTSSGTLGSSFSYGVADAAMIIASDAALADAVATGACNMVKEADDVAAAAQYACNIKGVDGALIICGDSLAAQGMIEIAGL